MQFRQPILAISDLADRSDPAVHLAGTLAQVMDTELHLLHAMGMKHRALRAVVPALNNLSSTLATVDRMLREQLQRVLPNAAGSVVHVVDLDDPLRALPARAAQLAPSLIVTPGIWEWAANGAHRRTGMTAALANLKAPVRPHASHNEQLRGSDRDRQGRVRARGDTVGRRCGDASRADPNGRTGCAAARCVYAIRW